MQVFFILSYEAIYNVISPVRKWEIFVYQMHGGEFEKLTNFQVS